MKATKITPFNDKSTPWPGRTFFNGQWRTPEAIEALKKYRREWREKRKKNKKVSPCADKNTPVPGRVWYNGSWKTPEQISKARNTRCEYQRKYYSIEANLINRREKANAWINRAKQANPERYRELQKQNQRTYQKTEKGKETRARCHRRFREEKRDRFNELYRNWYRRNTPTAGLHDALSEFRSGNISFDELNRRYDAAIAKANALISKARKR